MTQTSTAVEVCAALGDNMRWTILTQVGQEPASASSLANHLPISRQAISQHLEILLETGLVERRRSGREIRYHALSSKLSATAQQIDALAAGWDQRLDTLKQQAEDSKGNTT